MEIGCMLEGAMHAIVDELNATNSSKLNIETDSLFIRSILLNMLVDELRATNSSKLIPKRFPIHNYVLFS